jgi:hypothetical protein
VQVLSKESQFDWQFALSSLLSHCAWQFRAMALHPTGLALPDSEAPAAPSLSHPQHFAGADPDTTSAGLSPHAQQSASGAWGWQCAAFSQTKAHLGFSQSAGRWHFQSQSGSSQTDSHAGVGLVHSVWQAGSLQTVSHFGQAPFSQCLTGQRTSHSGLSHLISHFEHPSSWHRVEQRGCSQIGSQTWLQTGDEHFHWHLLGVLVGVCWEGSVLGKGQRFYRTRVFVL